MQKGKMATLCRIILFPLCLAALMVITPFSADASPPSDPAELEAFLDGFLASAMERDHVPGLVFVKVKDGQDDMREMGGSIRWCEMPMTLRG